MDLVTYAINKKYTDKKVSELSKEMVKTINGVAPDENGNVQIEGAGVAVDETLTEAGKAADAKAVGDELKLAIKGEMVAGINLFNKNTVTRGYYVKTQTGELVEGANFCASDYIAVEPNTTYTATFVSNSCMYKANKAYKTYIATSTFTTSSDAAFVRLTINNKDTTLNSFMLVKGDKLPDTYYPYKEDGEVVLSISSFNHDPLISELKEKLGISPAGNVIDKLRKHLQNPFVRTQIKLAGDSITAGVGGTGYSETGELMFDNQRANVLTATCWSNMLYHYIDKRYNRDYIVSPKDEHFIYKTSAVSIESASYYHAATDKTAVFSNNSALGRAAICNFFGDHIGIYYTKSPDSGVLDVYVDEVLKTSIDAYALDNSNRNKIVIDGLTDATHELRIDATGRKNDSSSGYAVKIEGYLIPKTAIVKPWGTSGASNYHSFTNREKLYSADDDFVIMQFGTNDRHVSMSEEWTTKMLVDTATYIREVCYAEPILMASCPSNVAFESDDPEDGVTRYYHMWDVKLAVQKAAETLGVAFVDNYDAFWRYCEAHDVDIDELLADGLHPNDLGYEVMFKNIMRSLGLPLVPAEYDGIVADY